MKRILGGFQQKNFEQAKRRYPRTMQKLVLAVKQMSQGRGIPRTIPTADVLGLSKLGVLELEVGEKTANIWLVKEAVPLLQQTTLAELQGYINAAASSEKKSKTSPPPVSGVQKKGEEFDGEWTETYPVAAVSGVN